GAPGSASVAFGDPAGWALTRVGRSRPTGDASESTIAPVWVPGDPPLLLAAGSGGELVAFDGGKADGSVRWRFRPEQSVYGPPGYDAGRGRVYFGAADKRLYALDLRGLFLWAFASGDNVASRPLAVGDLVIFGSEDRNVYALDAATGAERWWTETGGAVVSGPAFTGSVVAIGSDDGGVYGL